MNKFFLLLAMLPVLNVACSGNNSGNLRSEITDSKDTVSSELARLDAEREREQREKEREQTEKEREQREKEREQMEKEREQREQQPRDKDVEEPEVFEEPVPVEVEEVEEGTEEEQYEEMSESTFSGGVYGRKFEGDGTYYGHTTGGHCSIRDPIPDMYSGMLQMASGQYGNSEMCGACIEGTGSGEGAGSNPIEGPFRGYIGDECSECSEGDLDFSESGDGRWLIEWQYVPCPGSTPTFSFVGSNPYYRKIQVRGTATPAESLSFNGQEAQRTPDNFFVLEGFMEDPVEVVVVTLDGKEFVEMVSM